MKLLHWQTTEIIQTESACILHICEWWVTSHSNKEMPVVKRSDINLVGPWAHMRYWINSLNKKNMRDRWTRFWDYCCGYCFISWVLSKTTTPWRNAGYALNERRKIIRKCLYPFSYSNSTSLISMTLNYEKFGCNDIFKCLWQ